MPDSRHSLRISFAAALLFLLNFVPLPAQSTVSQHTATQPTVFYFGDSITEGWMDAERHPEAAYPALLDSMLRAEGVNFRSIVAAVGGETTADALHRIDTDVLSVNPDVVVFAFGSNDYFIWDNPPAPRVSLDRFRGNCRVLFRKLLGSGAGLIVLAPPPVIAERFYNYFDSTLYAPYGGVDRLRDTYADALADVVKEFPGVLLLQPDSIFADDPSLLGFDGVHPLPEGHRRIAGMLRDPILSLLARGRSLPLPLEMISVYPLPYQRFAQDVSSIGFHSSEKGEYILRIHDFAGRQVRKIVYYAHSKGNHGILWNGRDDNGTMVASGAYTLSLLSAHSVYRTIRILVL